MIRTDRNPRKAGPGTECSAAFRHLTKSGAGGNGSFVVWRRRARESLQFHPEAGGGADVCAGGTHLDVVAAGLDGPAAVFLPVGEPSRFDFQSHVLGFPGLKERRWKALLRSGALRFFAEAGVIFCFITHEAWTFSW